MGGVEVAEMKGSRIKKKRNDLESFLRLGGWFKISPYI